MNSSLSVCLLGIEGESLDEGMKNYSQHLYTELDNLGVAVELVDLGSIFTPATLQNIRSFDPDILHLIPGPTAKSLVLLEILGNWFDARTVISALHPTFFLGTERLLSYFTADLALVQSEGYESKFRSAGIDTEWMASGVDTERFTPVSSGEKADLRERLGLPQEERIFLHVGHLKETRNVLELIPLQEYGSVVVIGSASTNQERAVVDRLRQNGCRVLTEYIENIEYYYQAADCYVFPTRDAENSIQLPLSVFEAMACNLPVISTPFGGLSHLFEEGSGLQFVERIHDISEQDLSSESTTATRDKVLDYSWERIAEQITQYYETL